MNETSVAPLRMITQRMNGEISLSAFEFYMIAQLRLNDCVVAQSEIAELCEMSLRRVAGNIAELKKLGWLAVGDVAGTNKLKYFICSEPFHIPALYKEKWDAIPANS